MRNYLISFITLLFLSGVFFTESTLAAKTIKVSLSRHTWTAYEDGQYVRSGPISAGKGYCKDIRRRCTTPVGNYVIYHKGGPGCKSTKFPVGKGGAPMPYCMFFKGGFALHGSPHVPNYHASHGCIRLKTHDARWLNQQFTAGSRTAVIIRH